MIILGRNIPIFCSLIVWFGVWEIVGQSGVLFLIPPFSDVAIASLDLLSNAKFLNAVLVSFEAFGLGIGLALSFGIPLGVLMGRVLVIDQACSMWVNLLVSAPLTALVPALMVLVGIGQPTVVVTVFLFAVWVVVLDTQAGIKNVSPSLIDMARAFGTSRLQLYTTVLFWAALPEILAGVRLALIAGVKGVIVGQLLVALLGLGELLEVYSQNFLMDLFWAIIVYVFVFAYLLAACVEHLERRIAYYSSTR